MATQTVYMSCSPIAEFGDIVCAGPDGSATTIIRVDVPAVGVERAVFRVAPCDCAAARGGPAALHEWTCAKTRAVLALRGETPQ